MSQPASPEPPPDAVEQEDGSFILMNSDGSSLRWTRRPGGDWRKPEHKRAGWSSGLPGGAVADRGCTPTQPRPRVAGATGVARRGHPLALRGVAGALLRAAGALPKRTTPAPRSAAVKEAVDEGPVSNAQQAIPAQQEPTAVTAAEPVVAPQPAVTAVQAVTVSDAGTAAHPQDQLLNVEERVVESPTKPAEALPEMMAKSEEEESTEASEPVAVSESVVTQESAMLPADFLEFCLGGAAAVLEAEIEQAAEEVGMEDETPKNLASAGECFILSMDPDSELDDEGDDLEDMFDFDPARVAELMNKGAQVEEITEHLQTAYADALERRLGLHADEEQAGEAATENEHCSDDAGRPQLEMGDLDALMTPDEFLTPLTTPKSSAEKPSEECVATRARASLDDTCCSTQERSRRSMAVQQRPSAAHRGSAAVNAMEVFGRRSIAQAQDKDKEALEDAVQDAVRRASMRHRRSVTKAVEVLEEAADALDLPLDAMSEEQTDSKVELIQQAMDEAYRRHRRNITEAVGDAVAGGLTEVRNAEAGAEVPVEDRIRAAVAGAYQSQCGVTYQRYDEASYQGYGDAYNYQGDSSSGCYPGYSEQWPSDTSGQQPYHDGTCASWGMQPQHHGQGWEAQISDQNWSQQSAGYGPCTKSTSWDARANGLRQANYSWGAG